jgi:Uma2 family endonuclease
MNPIQVASTLNTIQRKAPTTHPITLENYLKREALSPHKNEYHNGQIVKMPGAKAKHNQIAMQTGAALITATENLELIYLVYNSDMKIYIPAYNQAVYPDAVVVCESPLYWNNREDIILNPVLVSQDNCSIETWHREAPGLWRETIIEGRDAIVHLASLGCDIALNKVYRNVSF